MFGNLSLDLVLEYEVIFVSFEQVCRGLHETVFLFDFAVATDEVEVEGLALF